MANQPQPRPWFRLPSVARPIQPRRPPPGPAPRPQMQAPAAPLPRPTMIQPTFRPPVGNQPQPAQDTTTPLQFPRPRIPPSNLAPVTTIAPPPLPPPTVVSPMTPPKLLSRINTISSVTRNSPPASPITPKSPASRNSPPYESPKTPKTTLPASSVTLRSPLASPASRKSPPYESPKTPKTPLPASPVTLRSPLASPVTQKSPVTSPVTQKPPSPRSSSPVSSTVPPPSSLPSSSQPKTQYPSPSKLPSPAIKQEVATSTPDSPAKHFYPSNAPLNKSTPVSSSRIAKPLPETPPESPKIQRAHYSPPSFSLPPSQLKSDGEYERNIPAVSEQKTVRHAQDKVGNPEKDPDGMYLKSKERDARRASNSEEIGRRVISISGENKGAVMELGHPPRTTHGKPHNFVGGYQKLRSDGKLSEGNLSGNEMQGSGHTAKAKPLTPMRAFMNSNIQGINDSIVFNSSLSNHDPGLHFSSVRKPVKRHLEERDNEQNLSRKEA